MRYSLFSRFRGTLLGAALGESFGSLSTKQLYHPSIGGKMAIRGAESLIGLGRLDVDDWQKRLILEFPQNTVNLISTGAIVGTLPIMLFSHEYKAKLRNNLQQVASIWQDDLELRDGALAVGYAIAQSLKEKLAVTTLIPKTIAFLQNSQTRLVQQLLAVQTLLEQEAGLEMAITKLCRDAQPNITPIALAFYCFLSTLEDFRLSMTRAARTNYQPQSTCCLVGALSGAYNSTVGIPLGWRIARSQTSWEINSATQLQLADQLFAVWSGVYEVSSALQVHQSSAIASPCIIQSR